MYSAVVVFFCTVLLVTQGSGLGLQLSSEAAPLWPVVNTSLWLASSTYCPSFSYLNRTYIGAAEGFVATSTFYDARTDTNGYIGYLPALKSIFVVFRGSASYNNWLSDLDALLVLYERCQLCFIHEGFFIAAKSVWSQIETGLKVVKTQFPDYDVFFAGHSLGGAVATVAAYEAVNSGFSSVRLITFGSPRVGNQHLADYASSVLHVSLRFTHNRDPVPHLPYTEGYRHISTEWFEDEKGFVRSCVGNEDPSCSDQFFLMSVEDHVVYLNMRIGCEAVSVEQEMIKYAAMNIPHSALKAHPPVPSLAQKK